jgi:Mg/Co/Ni transporter MgtE
MATKTKRKPPALTPELLYLLLGDPSDFEAATAGVRAADLAEALVKLSPDAGAKVIAALPFDMAVQVLDEPELALRRCDIIQHVPQASVAPLIDAMSSDQQADLFRELP